MPTSHSDGAHAVQESCSLERGLHTHGPEGIRRKTQQVLRNLVDTLSLCMWRIPPGVTRAGRNGSSHSLTGGCLGTTGRSHGSQRPVPPGLPGVLAPSVNQEQDLGSRKAAKKGGPLLPKKRVRVCVGPEDWKQPFGDAPAPQAHCGAQGRGAGPLAEVISTFPCVKGDAVPAFETSVEGSVRLKQDMRDFNICSGSP